MKITTRSILGSVAVGGLSTLALTVGGFDRAQAATISLGNTGAGTYTLDSAPSGATTTVSTVPNGFPIPPWLANNATSSWIGPSTFETNSPPGDYTYSTTFDLTGLVASTAQISGSWGVDNSAVSILLNGQSAGITTNLGAANFSSLTPFTIANTGSNFLSGINTLSFTLNNAQNQPGDNTFNPTGLRVELAGTADVAATEVPEPSDLVGTAFAFGSVVLLKRKLSKKTAKLDRISK